MKIEENQSKITTKRTTQLETVNEEPFTYLPVEMDLFDRSQNKLQRQAEKRKKIKVSEKNFQNGYNHDLQIYHEEQQQKETKRAQNELRVADHTKMRDDKLFEHKVQKEIQNEK